MASFHAFCATSARGSTDTPYSAPTAVSETPPPLRGEGPEGRAEEDGGEEEDGVEKGSIGGRKERSSATGSKIRKMEKERRAGREAEERVRN